LGNGVCVICSSPLVDIKVYFNCGYEQQRDIIQDLKVSVEFDIVANPFIPFIPRSFSDPLNPSLIPVEVEEDEKGEGLIYMVHMINTLHTKSSLLPPLSPSPIVLSESVGANQLEFSQCVFLIQDILTKKINANAKAKNSGGMNSKPLISYFISYFRLNSPSSRFFRQRVSLFMDCVLRHAGQSPFIKLISHLLGILPKVKREVIAAHGEITCFLMSYLCTQEDRDELEEEEEGMRRNDDVNLTFSQFKAFTKNLQQIWVPLPQFMEALSKLFTTYPISSTFLLSSIKPACHEYSLPQPWSLPSRNHLFCKMRELGVSSKARKLQQISSNNFAKQYLLFRSIISSLV